MRRTLRTLTATMIAIALLAGVTGRVTAQTLATDDPVLKGIWTEATENSQLPVLAHELLDVIGPRLPGTPGMKKANDWAVATFGSWGIAARNEQYGTWRGWTRGISHIDLMSPRVRSLEGMMLAWSPGTRRPVTAEAVVIPTFTDEAAFKAWLPSVKGKFVLISQPPLTGRPTADWEEYGTRASREKLQEEQQAAQQAWRENLRRTGIGSRELPAALEGAGAAGLVSFSWSGGYGVRRVFSASTRQIPTVDLSLEDYGLVWRLADSGDVPTLRIEAEAQFSDPQPVFNTIATIPGTERPDEYIVLSAHFDSWDGSSGATDNATGSITMMEAARILKKLYPNPKRTIVIGLWNSEEQGLNGSRAFVEDHPEIVENMQAGFNQDNGTGRVTRISGQGFLHAGEFLGRWITQVPSEVSGEITLTFPGMPGGGGSDYASFVAAGAPGFSLSSLSWNYSAYTWHTNRDTYDKLIFDDLMNNVVLVASMTYLASEDPETFPRDRRLMPIDPRTGERRPWPQPQKAERNGGGEAPD